MKKYFAQRVFIFLFLSCMMFVHAQSSNYRSPENLDYKGKAAGMDFTLPSWASQFIMNGNNGVQAMSQFYNVYCIVGEASGENKRNVIAQANISGQLRISSGLIHNSLLAKYEERIPDLYNSTYSEKVDHIITATALRCYTGAKREDDWWTLRRLYNLDDQSKYEDEYISYVLFTIPKEEFHFQIAMALENTATYFRQLATQYESYGVPLDSNPLLYSTTIDSELYDITMDIARNILMQGL
jgi:hypothetical protein